MEEVKFNSLDELYDRILPALKSKKKIIVSDGYKSIKENDIWDYMRNVKWNNSVGLELCDMVSDILHTDNMKIVDYIHRKLNENDFELPKLKV